MGRTPTGETRKRVFEFVRSRLLEGRPPTVREVQDALGFSAVESARGHLEALVADGLLFKESGKARGYRLSDLLPMPDPVRMVPLLGRVQAGPFSAAIEDAEGYLPLPSRFPEKELFALRVRGDIVVVRRNAAVESGDIVVASVGDDATVKRLWRRGRRVELRAENPRYSPIVPRAEELVVLGKVIEVRRYLENPPLVSPPPP
jgi:repressor LexA